MGWRQCCECKAKRISSEKWIDSVSLHKFPADAECRKEWIRRCESTNSGFKYSESSLVCSKHFTDDCFENKSECEMMESAGKIVRKILKPTAVPSIRLPKVVGEERTAPLTKRGEENEMVVPIMETLSESSVKVNTLGRSHSTDCKQIVEERIKNSSGSISGIDQTDEEEPKLIESAKPSDVGGRKTMPAIDTHQIPDIVVHAPNSKSTPHAINQPSLSDAVNNHSDQPGDEEPINVESVNPDDVSGHLVIPASDTHRIPDIVVHAPNPNSTPHVINQPSLSDAVLNHSKAIKSFPGDDQGDDTNDTLGYDVDDGWIDVTDMDKWPSDKLLESRDRATDDGDSKLENSPPANGTCQPGEASQEDTAESSKTPRNAFNTPTYNGVPGLRQNSTEEVTLKPSAQREKKGERSRSSRRGTHQRCAQRKRERKRERSRSIRRGTGQRGFSTSESRQNFSQSIGHDLTTTDINEIEKRLSTYGLPSRKNVQWNHAQIDLVTEQIFMHEGIQGVTPYTSTANGDCLYNSVSVAMYGTESFASELRRRTALFLYINAYQFSADSFYKLTGRSISQEHFAHLMNSSLDLRNNDMSYVEATRRRSKDIDRPGKFSGILEVIALSNILKITVNVIYPCHINPFTIAGLFSGLFTPADEGLATDSCITISWTHIRDINTGSGTWKPNHFVPCHHHSEEGVGSGPCIERGQNFTEEVNSEPRKEIVAPSSDKRSLPPPSNGPPAKVVKRTGGHQSLSDDEVDQLILELQQECDKCPPGAFDIYPADVPNLDLNFGQVSVPSVTQHVVKKPPR